MRVKILNDIQCETERVLISLFANLFFCFLTNNLFIC